MSLPLAAPESKSVQPTELLRRGNGPDPSAEPCEKCGGAGFFRSRNGEFKFACECGAHCPYCKGTGWIECCRACRCQRDGSHEHGCDDGWITVYKPCDCAAPKGRVPRG